MAGLQAEGFLVPTTELVERGLYSMRELISVTGNEEMLDSDILALAKFHGQMPPHPHG